MPKEGDILSLGPVVQSPIRLYQLILGLTRTFILVPLLDNKGFSKSFCPSVLTLDFSLLLVKISFVRHF